MTWHISLSKETNALFLFPYAFQIKITTFERLKSEIK